MPLGSKAYVILKGNKITNNTVTADTYHAMGGGIWLVCNGLLANNMISCNSIIHNATDYQGNSGGVGCYSSPTDRRKIIVEFNSINHNSIVSKSIMMSGLCACGGGVRLHGSYGRFDKNEVCFNELGSQSDQTAGGAGIIINEAPDSLVIESNAINNNLVKQGWGIGGGVLIGVNSSPVFVNNIIEANSSNDGGGLMIGGSSVVQFINNTVINNQATNTGGGSTIRNFSTVYLMNSIFWGNFASANAGINLEDATIKAAFCDIQGGWVGTGNINLDPQLDADGLLDSSPCIGS